MSESASESEYLKRVALLLERKANEAAASDEPWALGNLRLYQNMASRYWTRHFAAARKARKSAATSGARRTDHTRRKMR